MKASEISTTDLLKLTRAAIEKTQHAEVDDFAASISRIAAAYRESNKTLQHVYVMKDGNKFKIGRAMDPNKRLKQLQGVAGRPNLAVVWTSDAMESKQASKLERALHKKFGCRSEWTTNVDTKEVDDFMKGYN